MRDTRLFVAAVLAAGSILTTSAHGAINTADAVVAYTPGDFTLTGTSAAYQSPSAALGPLDGETGFGGLNPFNPAFSTGQIVGVGAGGQLTLHLARPLTSVGGPSLGVFVNNGLIDVSADGTGTAGTPAATFSDLPAAIVAVSADGVNFATLFGGAPVTFSNPTNYYADGRISGYFEPPGSVVADQSKPFTGTLSSFDGETFDQIKATLAGSAGGTWLDVSGAGLSAINDVRFSVPAGASYRLLLDSVSAVPEPATAAVGLIVGAVGLLGRRRR